MASQAVTSGSEKKNGGTILYGGTISLSTKWNSMVPSTNLDAREFSSCIPPVSSYAGTSKPITAGAYGKMEAGKYVAKIIGTRIAQTDNTILQSGASSFYRFPIKQTQSARRLNITAWNAVTGAATKGGNAGDLYSYKSEDGSSTGIDQAANPSRSVPGELVYLYGAIVPKLDDYKAITQI